MTDIVLVHGGAHGAWCWERLIPVLVDDPRVGQVIAVDLPGHGTNSGFARIDEITLDDYVDHVVGVIERHDLDGVLLVGHSLAGITNVAVAHRVRDRIARVICIATSQPAIGQSVLDVVFDLDRPELRTPVRIPEQFCTDFDQEEVDWLAARLGPEPPQPLDVAITVERPPDGVPVTYVLCERDEALHPELQAEQAERVGGELIRLDSGHSPFVTHVEDLARILLERA